MLAHNTITIEGEGLFPVLVESQFIGFFLGIERSGSCLNQLLCAVLRELEKTIWPLNQMSHVSICTWNTS